METVKEVKLITHSDTHEDDIYKALCKCDTVISVHGITSVTDERSQEAEWLIRLTIDGSQREFNREFFQWLERVEYGEEIKPYLLK